MKLEAGAPTQFPVADNANVTVTSPGSDHEPSASRAKVSVTSPGSDQVPLALRLGARVTSPGEYAVPRGTPRPTGVPGIAVSVAGAGVRGAAGPTGVCSTDDTRGGGVPAAATQAGGSTAPFDGASVNVAVA